MDWSEAQSMAIKTEHGHRLRKLGQLAAGRYLSDGIPLNDSVDAIATKTSLNPEETKRVCEFANNEVLLKKLAAGERKVSFPLADATEILKSEPEARPMVTKVAAREITEDRGKLARFDTDIDTLNLMMFGPEHMQKVAELEQAPRTDGGVYEILANLRDAREQAQGMIDAYEELHKEALAEVAADARTLLLTGTPLEPLVKLCRAQGVVDSVIVDAIKALPDYQEVTVLPGGPIEIDDSHPFLGKIARARKLAEEAGKARAARDLLGDHIKDAEARI